MENELSNKLEYIQRDFAELNNMFELSIIANRSSDLKMFINNVVEFVERTLGVEDVYFFLPEGKNFTIVNGNDYLELNHDNGGLWKLLRESALVRFVNPEGDILYRSFVENNGLRKINTHYLRGFNNNESLIAICSVGSKSNSESLSESDYSYLNKVFNYIEPLINRYVTEESKQVELRKIYKTLHNVSILYNISQAMNFIDDLKRLLKVILDKAIDTIDAEKGSLMLYDFSENALQVKVVYGLKDKAIEESINTGVIECAKINAGEGIAGAVFSSKKSVISNLGQDDPRFKSVNSSSADINSLLCVPLISKGEAIGVINITNKKNNRLFNKQDLEFMEALANQAAIAIDNAKLYELATKDGLTNLYTHRHFFTMLDTEIRRAARYNHDMSVLMIDIDDFKLVNDTYGHAVGDKVLRELALTIKNTIRNIDVAARYGGEEFSVILPETVYESAFIIGDRLREKIQNLSFDLENGVKLKVTISMGIASFPSAGSDEITIMEHADKALYHSKNSGKNCIHIYDGTDYRLMEKSE